MMKNININSARFRAINKEQVDEIATKSCKKKTHKQTTWGVKVFRRKFFKKIFLSHRSRTSYFVNFLVFKFCYKDKNDAHY